MACYYIVISSTHLRDGQLRSIKGVFRGPIGSSGHRNADEGDSSLYCELCNKQYLRPQQFDNHINSYDHHHKQRLKELRQREFYRALACRRQRRLREERRRQRSFRRPRHLQNEERRGGGEEEEEGERRDGVFAPGSGPMFRSTTVAVEPTNASGPAGLKPLWADVHAKTWSPLAADPQSQLMQPFLSLNPSLATDLINNAPHWDSPRLSGNAITTNNRDTNTDDPGVEAITGSRHPHNASVATDSLPHSLPGASHPLTTPIGTGSSCKNTGRTPNKTGIGVGGQPVGRSPVCGPSSRIRPVSFSLPKKSCLLLHQSAAVFIQARRDSGLVAKQASAMAMLTEKNSQPGIRVTDQTCPSPVTPVLSTMIGDGPTGDNGGFGTQASVANGTGPQHSVSSETGMGASNPADSRRRGLPDAHRGEAETQVALCGDNRRVDSGVSLPIDSGKLALLPLDKDHGVAAAQGSVMQTGVLGYLNEVISDQITPGNKAGRGSSCLEGCETEIPHETGPDSPPTSTTTPPLSLFPYKPVNPLVAIQSQPQKSNPSVLSQLTDSNSSVPKCAKESPVLIPCRPKEPFCQVQSRDGTTVLLWPTEMISFTKTTPSISFSVNPLLYDFRAQARAREASDKGSAPLGAEAGGTRGRKRSILDLKTSKRQERQKELEGGGDQGREERHRVGGAVEAQEAGSGPVELTSDGSHSDALPECHGEGVLKPSTSNCSKETSVAHILGSRLQSNMRSRRKRRRRGGVRRGLRRRGKRNRGKEKGKKDPERARSVPAKQSFEGEQGGTRKQGEGTETERERGEKVPLSNLLAVHGVGMNETKRRGGAERGGAGNLTESTRPGRNDETEPELLSNLPVNGCNRCNQLCLQVKREASLPPAQRSGSAWDGGLRISPFGSTPCGPAISPIPGPVGGPSCWPHTQAGPGLGGGASVEKTHGDAGGRLQRDGGTGQEQGNTGAAWEITAERCVREAREMVCNRAISRLSSPCGETAANPEINTSPAPHTAAACDPEICRVPGRRPPPFSQRPSCSLEQIQTEGISRSEPPSLHSPPAVAREQEVTAEHKICGVNRKRVSENAPSSEDATEKRRKMWRSDDAVAWPVQEIHQRGQSASPSDLRAEDSHSSRDPSDDACERNTKATDRTNGVAGNTSTFAFPSHTTEPRRVVVAAEIRHANVNHKHTDSRGSNEKASESDVSEKPDHCHTDLTNKDPLCGDTGSRSDVSDTKSLIAAHDAHDVNPGIGSRHPSSETAEREQDRVRNQVVSAGRCSNDKMGNATAGDCSDIDVCTAESHSLRTMDKYSDCPLKTSEKCVACEIGNKGSTIQVQNHHEIKSDHVQPKCSLSKPQRGYRRVSTEGRKCDGSGNVGDDISSFWGYSLTHSNQFDQVIGVQDCPLSTEDNEGVVSRPSPGMISMLGCPLEPQQGCRPAKRGAAEGKRTQETEGWGANVREEEILKERERRQEERANEQGRRQEWEAENQWILTFDRLHPTKRPGVLRAAVPMPCVHLHPPLLLAPPLPSSSSSPSFSFHRTVIRHHLALPPPPPPPQHHLPLSPYPHLLPSFPPHHHHHHHLPPMSLSPQPSLPTFYPSPLHHHLLEHPGAFPIATTFHPMPGHHSPLFSQTHGTVMPMQVLF
ncbi:uncharacterized protein LOC132473144 [Gadus macrocephalus]|uniref:uncharacterized protein LOC132473144 n=1 Tax=Gadus macrocephalus TaxID=80720 RepID=UPI0028CB4821|nr:uncharacterized protein LOC132473144 [Gadus macrocephalus]